MRQSHLHERMTSPSRNNASDRGALEGCFESRPRRRARPRTKADYDDEHEDEHLHWHVRHSGESRNPGYGRTRFRLPPE